MGNVENGVQTLYYGLGIIFMLGGAVAAYVRALQTRIGKQERDLARPPHGLWELEPGGAACCGYAADFARSGLSQRQNSD
jgi:hypothetical protein